MHERAGDVPPKRMKRKYRSLFAPSVESRSTALVQRPLKVPQQQQVAAEQKEFGKGNEGSKIVEQPVRSGPVRQMTRRFTVAEKLRIIQKHKELKSIRATTR